MRGRSEWRPAAATAGAGSLLDEAVSSAFRTCKYTPGTKQGAKKKVRLQIRHTFLGA